MEIMPEMDKQNKLVVDKFTMALAAIPPTVAKIEKEIEVGLSQELTKDVTPFVCIASLSE